jgi:hypothetical protein
MPDTLNSKQARQTEKMIEIRIRLWTNDIAATKGEIVPKHAWDSGVVFLERNQSHEIQPSNPKPFHTLLELPSVLEKLFIKHGIQLHPSRQTRKYFVAK